MGFPSSSFHESDVALLAAITRGLRSEFALGGEPIFHIGTMRTAAFAPFVIGEPGDSILKSRTVDGLRHGGGRGDSDFGGGGNRRCDGWSRRRRNGVRTTSRGGHTGTLSHG